MDNSHDIATLNGLIETTLDSADGYHHAAKEVDTSRFSAMFAARATSRRQIVSDLQAEVRHLGGKPEDDGTVLAAAHRMFLNVKNTLSGGDQAVVNEVEAGEDHIKAKFEKAMADTEVSSPVKAVITRAYTSVKADHDKMRDLKHAMQAGKAA